MEEFQKNHQLVYFHPNNAKALSMNLLTFAYKQFVTTTKYKKLNILKELCTDFTPNDERKLDHIVELAMEQLIDSIKITICFENFIKSLLVLNDLVIHKLDKNIFPELSIEQGKRPIHLSEIRKIKEWQINPKVDPSVSQWQIKGINKFTLGMKELLIPGYLTPLNISDEIIRICGPYFQYRNNLHYYMQESFTLTQSDYEDFIKMIKFINLNHIKIQNQIVDDLGKGDQYKLSDIKLDYSFTS